MMCMGNDELLRDIKHRFMVFRNGLVADALRKGGMPHKVIFGLQLPQISAIAKEIGKNDSLADMLWKDENVRESRLLAAYIWNPETLEEDKAVTLANSALTREETDILSFRLLRYSPKAEVICNRLSGYAKEALMRNLK